ncbi:hypothetical protein JR316_0012602 [Psilocybe cubensis]|uniref:FAD dependent oxidoreductase domain-containing protein n=2 Tax=Psilocybe cubensis TaxID=181762 RepID=A0A8H8CGF7_PSICU|nr:hypothetical protein JR316_0012602 [Psilocybe cubensis]KAH9475491.1 hypothetical protein JR316_0012602 [Psilocybe cubensis]
MVGWSDQLWNVGRRQADSPSSMLSTTILLLLTCTLHTTRGSQIDTSQPHTSIENADAVAHTATIHDCQVVFDPNDVRKGTSDSRIPLPVDNPTKSFWIDTPDANPLSEYGSTGELTTDADICIIGSGITGVSAAWHLSKLLGDNSLKEYERQRSVVILEARRNGGHLTPILFHGFSALQARYNTTEALKSFALEAHTSDAIVKFIKQNGLEHEVDLVEGGHLTLLRNKIEEQAFRDDWEKVKSAGSVGPDAKVEWIDNEELSKKYHVDPKLGYSAVHQRGHNLWPCKLVTHLFKDAQTPSPKVAVELHTKTPVTAITKIERESSKEPRRRWNLHTPRGNIDCEYVIHATNGYASHLLPFLAGLEEEDAESIVEYGLNEKPGSVAGAQDVDLSSTESQLPRGAYGIKPTRGQVGAVRSSVNASSLGWLTSWDGGNGGDEYWFPRYQDTEHKNPLIILGGGRYASEGRTKEVGVWDDSVLNPRVSNAIRTYLPVLFPDQFAKDGEWEMEWSGIMAFTKSGDPFVGPVQPIQTAPHTQSIENPYAGQYISAGYSGHGMPRAYACAQAVASIIAAQIQREDWTPPSWLPERYLTWATVP